MKQIIIFDDLSAIEVGLKNLRRYNQAMYISVDDALIDDSLASLYFRAEQDSDIISLEKIIGASAIQACNDNPDIPSKYKQKVGNRMQREFLSAFRAARVDFQYHSGKFGVPASIEAERERERRHKEISIVSKTAYLDKATKLAKRIPERTFKRDIVRKLWDTVTDNSSVAKWATRATMWAGRLIPDSVKVEVKKTANDFFEKTATIIEKNVERFSNTSFGSKVVKVLNEKVAPVIERGVDKVIEACSKVKQAAKSVWTKVKSIFA